jgi:hypothetical protein
MSQNDPVGRQALALTREARLMATPALAIIYGAYA